MLHWKIHCNIYKLKSKNIILFIIIIIYDTKKKKKVTS